MCVLHAFALILEHISSLYVVSPLGSVVAFPETVNALPSEILEFHCMAQGGPGNTFQWTYLRDNTLVSNDSLLNLTSTAIIGGDYLCNVSNQAGVDTTKATINGRL